VRTQSKAPRKAFREKLLITPTLCVLSRPQERYGVDDERVGKSQRTRAALSDSAVLTVLTLVERLDDVDDPIARRDDRRVARAF